MTSIIWKLATAILLLGGITIYILHINQVGYSISPSVSTEFSSEDFFKKDSQQMVIKTITYENNFITPRKIVVSDLLACVTDFAAQKQSITLSSSTDIETRSRFLNKSHTPYRTGQPIWLLPFSTLQVSYSVKGDWYDYIYQYTEYDDITFVPIDSIERNESCDSITGLNNVEKISITEGCIGCVESSVDGPDIAVIDFITNDNIIWKDGYISFIPIIKNIGNDSSGSFKVTYSLNGKFSNSFELPNLESGEIVNSFIAGSGFKGNFSPSEIKPEMTLQIDIVLANNKDIDPENNRYKWQFQYTDTPQSKHSCTYDDNNLGPEDFYTSSSITYGNKSFSDVCADEKHLLEYLCDQHPVYDGDDSIEVFLYRCPQGCQQGACLGEFTEQHKPVQIRDTTVIDPDDPANTSLEFGQAAKTPSVGHTAVVYNDKMYVYGGYNLKDKFLNILQIYDFKTGEWSQGPPDRDSGGSADHTAVVYNDKMYIYTENKLRVFDFLTNSWSEGSQNMLDVYGRSDHTAVVYEDKMYVYGGGQSNWARNLYIYDFATQAWSLGTPSPEELPMHATHTAVVYGDKMYIFGGNPLTGLQDQTNTMLIYDFKLQTWNEGKADNLTKGRYEHTANIFNNKMYIIGGIDGELPGYISSSVRFYDFVTQTWLELGKISQNFRVSGHSAVVYDNKLYIVGGEKAYFDRDISHQLIIMKLDFGL